MITQLEKDVQNATRVRPLKDETRQEYLDRILDAISSLDDDGWRALPSDAQDWYNLAQEASNNDQEIPDFPGEPEEQDVAEEETTDVATTATNVTNSKKATTAAKAVSAKIPQKAAAKSAPAKANGARKQLTEGAQTVIKRAILKKPTISTDDLKELLAKKELKTSDLTISTIRSDFRHSLKVLQSAGFLTDLNLS